MRRPVTLILLGSSLVAACSRPDGLPHGQVQALITGVPSGVGCVEVIANTAPPIVSDVDVRPGDNTTVLLANVPAGPITLSAYAFPGGCAQRPGAIASWASAP